MAYKVVKYRLTSAGTIPTFLKFGVSQSTGGMYPVADASTASPQDWIMLGIADDGADITDAIAEVGSKNDLTTYLTSVSVVDGTQTWKTGELDSDGNEVDFVPADAATAIWDDLDALNA
tara:strand:- start:305 stop:661 length:357 start_codon:yes stop_codon:yes gene_type:complete